MNDGDIIVATARNHEEKISITVRGQDGVEWFFKFKQTSPLRKLMDKYAQYQCVSPSAVWFEFSCRRISDSQTANDLDTYGKRHCHRS